MSLDDAGDDVGEVSERLDAVEYGATIWMRTRIASSEMLLRIDLLPHQRKRPSLAALPGSLELSVMAG